LQPDRQTPVGFPGYAETRVTQVIEQEMLLAASGAAIALSTLIPASWATGVYQLDLYNLDSTSYVSVVAGTLKVTLVPNGGHFSCSFNVGGTEAILPGTFTVQATAAAGSQPAPNATKLYVYLAGA
jgi:hypothetical protein